MKPQLWDTSVLLDSSLSPVVVEPGSVAGNDDVMGLFRHVVLVQV